MMWRRPFRIAAALVLICGAGVGYARWHGSALHRSVCGDDVPYGMNARWAIYGERMLEGWQAKVCACTAPPGYEQHQARFAFRAGPGNPHYGWDKNAAKIQIGDGQELRMYLRRYGFSRLKH